MREGARGRNGSESSCVGSDPEAELLSYRCCICWLVLVLVILRCGPGTYTMYRSYIYTVSIYSNIVCRKYGLACVR